MASYSMTCSCGQTMSLEAASREEAVGKFRSGMTQEAVDQHFRDHNHGSDPKPTLAEVHAAIEQMVAPA